VAKITSGFNSDRTIRKYAHLYHLVPIAGLYWQK